MSDYRYDRRSTARRVTRTAAAVLAFSIGMRTFQTTFVLEPVALAADKEPVRQAAHTQSLGSERAIRDQHSTDGRSVQAPGGLPGAARSAEQKTRIGDADRDSPAPGAFQQSATKPMLTSVVSLAAVIGLSFAVIWGLRRSLPTASRRLPGEVFEVLGHAALGHRRQAQLIRLGSKLLLIGINSSGAETLSEVTDANEVDRLALLCRGGSGAGTPVSFRSVLQQVRQRQAGGTSARAHSGAKAGLKSAQETSLD
jgi:flagellar biogenesis protein FliO